MITSDDPAIFLGVVAHPKTHQPIWVFRKHDSWRSVTIFTYEAGLPVKVGEGYLEGDSGEYTRCVDVTGFPRGHTPSGVPSKYQGGGYGTCLYTGLVLLASAIKDGEIKASRWSEMPGDGYGISSDSKSRTAAASRWWRAMLERGLTQQKTGDIDGGEDEEEEKTEEDVDLTDNMSSRTQNQVFDAIRNAVSDHGDGYPTNIVIRGDLVRTVYKKSSSGELTADYYTLTSAEKFGLVAVRDTYEGPDVLEAGDKWSRSAELGGTYFKDVILALNVSQENPFLVARLAACARDAGATEDEAQALLLRANLGFDLLKGTMGTTSLGSIQFGATVAPGMGQILHGNPGKRRGKRRLRKLPPDFEPRDPRDKMRRNPTSPAQERLLEREAKALAARRAKLGWSALEDVE